MKRTKDHKKKRQNKRRRRLRRGSPRVDTTDVNAITKAHKKRQNKSRRRPRRGLPRVDTTDGVNPSPVKLANADWQKEDPDVGGRYKIPKKLKK